MVDQNIDKKPIQQKQQKSEVRPQGASNSQPMNRSSEMSRDKRKETL